MSTRGVEFHVAVCDGCGESLADQEEAELCWGLTPYCWGHTPGQAVDIALGALWNEVGDRLLCPDCQPEEQG